jgi:hypothetical protein
MVFHKTEWSLTISQKKKKKKKSLGLVKSGKFPYLDEIKFHSLKKLKIIITLYIKKK